MEKEFVPYEPSLVLRELGFDKPCLGYYFGKDKQVYTSNEDVKPPFMPSLDSKVMFRAPLYRQAFRWFREKYDIDIYIDIIFLKHDDGISLKKYKVLIPFPNELFIDVGLFTTHEEAELECLKKLIEIVKTK
jgi:hypothetical protein